MEQLEYSLSDQLNIDHRKTDQLARLQAQEGALLAKINDTFARFHQQLSGLFCALLDGDLKLWHAERKQGILDASEADRGFQIGNPDKWISQRAVSATAQLRKSAESDLRELVAAFLNLQRSGNQLLERKTLDLQVNEFDVLRGLNERNIEIPRLLPFQWSPPEWTRAIPSNWLRKKAATHFEREFSLAVDSYWEAVRPLLEQACRRWLELGRREAEQVIRAYTERFEALSNRSGASETASILRDLIQRLNEIAEIRLEDLNGPAMSGAASHFEIEAGSSTEVCFVCRKVSEAAFQFLSRFQYQLTKDPALRDEISTNGGLCSFHTWMYESVGSPQGIALGYASVLEELAHRLERLVQAETITQMSEKMTELLPASKNCTICRVASGAEALALEAISRAKPADGTHRNVCLIHLAALIVKVNDSDSARQWIRREAVQFHRLAQDMQQFALKHNALRHYLSAEGERHAHLRALAQLAGARQLSFVHQIQDLL